MLYNQFLAYHTPQSVGRKLTTLRERTVRIRKVAGSIPVRSTKNAAHRFRLAKFVQPRFFHRGIIPLLTLFFSASGSQKTAVTPCGGSVPWRPSLITRASGSFLPPHSPTHRAQVRSEFLPQGHTAPRHSHPASRERQRSAPRQGGCVLSAFYYNKSISRLIHLYFHRRARYGLYFPQSCSQAVSDG